MLNSSITLHNIMVTIMKILIKKYFSLVYIVLMLASLSFLTYCSDEDTNPVDNNGSDETINIEGYELFWNDEFNGSEIDFRADYGNSK